MAKTIGTILSLTDKVSPKLITIGKNFDTLDKKQQAAVKSAAYQLNNYAKSLGSAVTTAAKFTAASAVALGATALKTGLTEAMGLETYRTQLLTATKDTQRAAEVMRYAINLANQTPFEGADMVAAASALEMAGMKTEKYLTLMGDVAAGANREVTDLQNAFTKAFSLGDYSALREATGLQINVETVAEYGRARGITDQAEALYTLLNDKFGGGMAQLAQTTKGAWSTITGATKNALANIVGATNEGTVRSGSALDKLKTKATELADTLVRWQSDGTIDALSTKAATGFDQVWTKAEGLLKFLGKYKAIIAGIGTATLAVSALSKGITALNTVLTATKALAAVVSGALTLSPVGVIAGVAALAGAAAVVSGTVSSGTGRGASITVGENEIYSADRFAAAAEAIDRLKTSSDLLTGTLNLLDAAGNGIAGAAIEVANGLQRITDWIKGLFENTMDKLYQTWAVDSKPFFANLWDTVSSGLKISKSVDHFFGSSESASGSIKAGTAASQDRAVSAYALGTHYHSGGAARLAEYGPELVALPQGSRVYNTNETRQIFNRGNTTIVQHFHFSGNIDEEKVADIVSGKIMEVLDNT